ncbi:hypothetical protein [Burkholderia diffusa]|uniref:hypothetical protein n=1 Tax=Burkholderia diffusa TaxID=488732 RepID=UPI002AAF7253|nr:hypothetical protein [Burkholderia diffusa]
MALNKNRQPHANGGRIDTVRHPVEMAVDVNQAHSVDAAHAMRHTSAHGGQRDERLLYVRGRADLPPRNSNIADEMTYRRIVILVLDQGAEQTRYRDSGRTTSDAFPSRVPLPAPIAQPRVRSQKKP